MEINIERILKRAILKTNNNNNGWYKSNISRCKHKLKNNNFKSTTLEYLLIQEIRFLEKIKKN
jgi:hypothetical protein